MGFYFKFDRFELKSHIVLFFTVRCSAIGWLCGPRDCYRTAGWRFSPLSGRSVAVVTALLRLIVAGLSNAGFCDDWWNTLRIMGLVVRS